jgi:hypothetical protein
MSSLKHGPSEMLSRCNRALIELLLRRYGEWNHADRDWLLNRLRAEHLAAFKRERSSA